MIVTELAYLYPTLLTPTHLRLVILAFLRAGQIHLNVLQELIYSPVARSSTCYHLCSMRARDQVNSDPLVDIGFNQLLTGLVRLL